MSPWETSNPINSHHNTRIKIQEISIKVPVTSTKATINSNLRPNITMRWIWKNQRLQTLITSTTYTLTLKSSSEVLSSQEWATKKKVRCIIKSTGMIFRRACSLKKNLENIITNIGNNNRCLRVTRNKEVEERSVKFITLNLKLLRLNRLYPPLTQWLSRYNQRLCKIIYLKTHRPKRQGRALQEGTKIFRRSNSSWLKTMASWKRWAFNTRMRPL